MPIRKAKRPPVMFRQPVSPVQADKVVAMAAHAPAYGVIERDGQIVVRFQDAPVEGGLQEVVVCRWDARPRLRGVVADYLSSRGAGMARATRHKVEEKLRVFAAYLDTRTAVGNGQVDDLNDITTEVVNGYERWLNEQVTPARDGVSLGQPWSAMTKASRYNALSDLVGFCRASVRHRDALDPTVRFRKNPWPGRHHTITSRPALSHLDLARIRKACIDEVKEILARLVDGETMLQESAENDPPAGTASVTAYASMGVRLRALLDRHDGTIPSRHKLLSEDPGLARSMVSPYGTAGETGTHLHFTARTLVPFVVLLATEGLFNPEGLLTLKWEDVERAHPVFGDARWRVGAEKRRAGQRHYRSFPTNLSAAESPVNLLKALERFGALARDRVEPRFRDRVFVFWQNQGTPFTGFEGQQGAASDGAWARSLASFCKAHDLPSFALTSLRITGGDVVDLIRGGDIKAKQAALGHTTTNTTDRYYQTSTGKQRGREALTEALAWRDRFISSEGKADTRGGRLSEGRHTAATPGFGCFEPMFSPQPGQREGRPCNAYGLCPACPLAWVDVSHPLTHPRLVEVRRLVMAARLQTHPDRWLSHWQPQLIALDNVWLKPFEGKTPQTSLPRLPPLE